MGRLRKEWTAKEFSIRKRGGRNLDRKGGFPRTPTHPSCSLEYTGPAGVHHDRERARHARDFSSSPSRRRSNEGTKREEKHRVETFLCTKRALTKPNAANICERGRSERSLTI